MKTEMIWFIIGVVSILLEFVIPGGIIVFLGMAAVIVAALIYFGVITSTVQAMLTFFVLSIFLMLVLRSIFIKYFEGDSYLENTDEDADAIGSVVEVVEVIEPHKEGRINFRGSTWVALGQEHFNVGDKAVISGRSENKWIIKSI